MSGFEPYTTEAYAPYRVTVELGYLPYGPEGAERIDAKRITIETTNTAITATAWRQILPVPLIHEAIRERADAIATAMWPGRTGLAAPADGAPAPGAEDQAHLLATIAAAHEEMRDLERAKHQPAAVGGQQKQHHDARDRRQRVAELHAEALQRQELAPRQFVIDALKREGISVSPATITRDLRQIANRRSSRS